MGHSSLDEYASLEGAAKTLARLEAAAAVVSFTQAEVISPGDEPSAVRLQGSLKYRKAADKFMSLKTWVDAKSSDDKEGEDDYSSYIVPKIDPELSLGSGYSFVDRPHFPEPETFAAKYEAELNDLTDSFSRAIKEEIHLFTGIAKSSFKKKAGYYSKIASRQGKVRTKQFSHDEADAGHSGKSELLGSSSLAHPAPGRRYLNRKSSMKRHHRSD